MIRAAPTTPVSWDLAPARSATAVRDPLQLTGKPWKRPAARFAAPMPIISWLPRISWPVLAANDEAVEIVSASETSAIPSAPASSSAEVGRLDVGDGQRREALGQRADEVDAVVGEVEDGRRRDREHDHDEHAGHRGQPAVQHEDQHDAGDAEHGRGRDHVAGGDALDGLDQLVDDALRVHREPEQLRHLSDEDGQRQPVHVADHGRLGQQVGDEAELRRPPPGP